MLIDICIAACGWWLSPSLSTDTPRSTDKRPAQLFHKKPPTCAQIGDSFAKKLSSCANVSSAFMNNFVEMDRNMTKEDFDVKMSGTTAVVVFVRGDQLYTANVGDSRAVMAPKTEQGLQAVRAPSPPQRAPPCHLSQWTQWAHSRLTVGPAWPLRPFWRPF
jgi:serine/threonine protein phosphatase PrpC